MHKRHFLIATASFLVVRPALAAGTSTLKVAKSPTCGCCTAWVEQMREAGFAVDTQDVDQDTLYALKDRLGITPDLEGCHTATIGDYFIEGHVPAEDIRRLLANATEARGIAVPGMPMGSPGMDMGGAREAYDVVLVLKDGSTQVFARHS
ncbi:hypothetical protein BDE40_3553 [Litoreibacter halocynthiae]|uniref:Metal-binding protein n=1 Tax=Litoreibacter halocynthiae TaxID=1242689 RepID=A0A4R7LEJ4_9RHOB|nr:DUF411 domain-containing protein [Litoreibacter halocynthiae]TDT72701.1 hypothetical protein BDE40_3553 [Litoreibacter halocynthiae]